MHEHDTQPEIKRQSRNRIYRFIHRQKRTSRQEIAKSLRMSMPTVLQNVTELIASGMVCELGQFVSLGGRKAAVLSPVAPFRYALGIDFSRHHVTLSMTDMAGQAQRFSRVRHHFSTGQEYFARLERIIDDFVTESGVDPSRILGAGVSLPAIYDKLGENILTSRILGLSAVSCQMFSSHIPYPCTFINVSDAACIAEMRALDNTTEHYVYVSIDDCIGGAVFIGGKLYEGDTLRSAEFGHMCLHPGGKTCFCGQRGCVNCYLSMLPLLEQAGSLEAFFELLKAGDQAFAQIWDTYLDDAAILVNNLRMAFDCRVILGGEVGGYMGPYLNELHSRLARVNAFSMDVRYVQECRVKQGAPSLGASLRLIDRFIDQV